MQKNIIFFLVLGVPTYGEGGVDLVGTKSQIFPMSLFEGSPKSKIFLLVRSVKFQEIFLGWAVFQTYEMVQPGGGPNLKILIDQSKYDLSIVIKDHE